MAEGKNFKTYRIKILSDSRGRDLPGLLNGNCRLIFSVECFPGASIAVLKDKLAKIGTDAALDLVIIFGGICSVTKIVFMPYRAALPRYSTVEEILHNYKKDCEALISYANNYLLAPVILAPVVGVDLQKYAGQSNKLLYDKQTLIDSSIPLINTYIKEVNGARGLITPNTSSCIHRCRGKGRGYRTHYLKLTDGCHPSDEVKMLWAKALVNCCLVNLEGEEN